MIKKTALFILFLLPVLVFGQGGVYIIKGSVGTYGPPAKAYLEYKTKNEFIIDSVNIVNGRFRFEGKFTDDPILGQILINPKGDGPNSDDSRQIYLDTGVTNITGNRTLYEANVSGSQINLDQIRLDTALNAAGPAYTALAQLENNATAEEKQTDAFRKETDRLKAMIVAQRHAIFKKFIEENPNSYVSLMALGTYTYTAEYQDAALLYKGLSEKIKETVRGKRFAIKLQQLKAVQLGAEAPEFTAADTSGNMISLSSFRGNYVLIDFWASWCGPCRYENPNLVKAFKRYKNNKFTILGVSLDQPNGRARWLAAIAKDGLTWPQVSELKFWDSAVAHLYGVDAIPQNFLIDPDGKIIAKHLRGDDLENKLEELFGK